MGSIGFYIFRSTFGAFAMILLSLTALIWMTQALRDFDIVTNQGQTVLVFIAITLLIIPMLVLIIAPIALVIAVSHSLNKLGNDSEIIVMNAAGMRPWHLFRPFLAVALTASVLVGVIGAWLAPEGVRKLRRWIVEIRTDLVTTIVQPGRFITMEGGLTFHLRERRANGQLAGILLDDRRDPKERITVLAETGEIFKNERGSFILLENGSIQRQGPKQDDPSIVRFERNAFDLSQISSSPGQTQYSPRERYIWELMWPKPDDPVYKNQRGQFRTELHDRIIAPLYPIAFTMIAFAFLGSPRTTRQSRGWSIMGVIGAVGVLRTIGFVSTVLGVQRPWFVAVPYIAIGITIVICSIVISRGLILEPPSWLVRFGETVMTLFDRQRHRPAQAIP